MAFNSTFTPIFGSATGSAFLPPQAARRVMFGMYSESQLNTMITSEAYIPIATADELDALRNATAQTFGAGSKWQGTYTSGLDKNYVLLNDIDLTYATQDPSGQFYNDGTGWNPIGDLLAPFLGSFDGAGRGVKGLYAYESGSDGIGLFLRADSAEIKNIMLYDFILEKSTDSSLNHDHVGLLAARSNDVHVQNILAHGVINARQRVTGLIGRSFSIEGVCVLENLFSSIASIGFTRAGTIVGRVSGDATTIKHCIGIGRLNTENLFRVQGISGEGTASHYIKNYYNTQTTGVSLGAHGIADSTETNQGKTTAELLALAPAEWDTSIWEFKSGRYPIQRIFGEQAVHRAPPLQPTATIDVGNIVLDWDDAPSEVDLPDGYFVYQSIDNGPWTKLNATAVTAKTYTVTSPAVGEHNYFVAAYYNDAAYKIKETGNSQTVTETIA